MFKHIKEDISVVFERDPAARTTAYEAGNE